MKRASITEAKNRLSALIDLVQGGETVIIEDRGRPVARLERAGEARDGADSSGRLARLERLGLIRRGKGGTPPILAQPLPKLQSDVDAVALLIEERRSGW